MEKKERPPSKKKRQAPLPPSQTIATARSSQLTSHSSKDITADIERVEKGEPQRVKRRAPLPPGAVEQPKGVSPSLTDSNSNPTGSAIESGPPTTLHGRGSSLKSGEVSRQGSRNSSASPDEQGPVLKSPPTFFAPPPPDESPPNEVYSPVGSFSATTPSPTKEFKFMGMLYFFRLVILIKWCVSQFIIFSFTCSTTLLFTYQYLPSLYSTALFLYLSLIEIQYLS